VPDANGASLVITNMQASDAGNYLLRVDKAEPPMTVFTKSVGLIGPVIFQPNQQFITTAPGSNVTFQIAFAAAPPVHLHWRHGQQLIPNETNATLRLTNVQLADEGEYSLVASNNFGAGESLQSTLTILIRPVITIQPVSQSVVAGGKVVLSVAASGHPLPLSYLWRKNDIALTNMVLYDTNCFFPVTDVQPDAGTITANYTVVITNLAGAASISSDAVLTVLADSDGDGLPDEWETANGLSITNASDAVLDSDGDGVTNGEEYLAGTNPRNSLDYLRLECVRANDPNLLTLQFLAVANRTYTLLGRGAFSPVNDWYAITDVPAASTNHTLEIQLPITNQQFFWLVTPRSR
jgi:hypothetical protein